MATPDYSVNYDDDRFQQVEESKKEALTDLEQTYGGMIDSSDQFYEDQINASKEWADKQTQLQQEQTDFTIEQVEQQKDQAHKDYLKEQSGAYTDWQKQSNQYGAKAEQMAAGGFTNTGYSESSQVSMYNTYQNRVSTARESYNRAVLNYDNAIKDARLQNNARLAEIAAQALQQQLELALEGFQYKNQLIIDQANKKTELENTYWNRYLDVLNQINTENAMAENVRQFEQNYKLELDKFDEQIRQFNEEIARLKAKDTEEAKQAAAELELKKQQLEEDKRQFNESMAEEKRQFNLQYNKSSGSSGSGSSGSGKISSGSGSSGSSGGTLTGNSGTLTGSTAKKATANALSSLNTSGINAAVGKTYKTTEYYKGFLPVATQSANLQYGTFSNGYQPKGINGYGKVTKTGKTVEVTATTLSGQKKTVTQNVWKTSDGSQWVWDGSKMKYIKV